MVERVAATPIALVGVPDGLEAFAVEQVGATGAVVRTRRGRAKLEVVELRSRAIHTRPRSAADTDLPFVLGAERRRWSTIEARFGERAWEVAVRLAAAGAVALRCGVDGGSRVGGPIDWRLTPELCAERARRRDTAQGEVAAWEERAAGAATGVEPLCAELASAVRTARSISSSGLVLLSAAEDLVAGVVHAGPRAFSQAHFGDTKVHDDVVDVLRRADVPDEVVLALGLRRSDRVGLAGPVAARIGERVVALDSLAGPTIVRVDQAGLTLSLMRSCQLVVVENLQAAEAIADRFGDIAVFYTAGMLGARALGLLAELGRAAPHVVLAVDADAGGVRIAEQVLREVPSALLLDAGAYPHVRREPWAPDGLARATLESAIRGPAGKLARACLERGYPVEQERAVVESVADAFNPHRGVAPERVFV